MRYAAWLATAASLLVMPPSAAAQLTRDAGAARESVAALIGSESAVPLVVHGRHRAASRVLIDPVYTHHAILEDELRITYLRRSDRSVYAPDVATLEVAYALTDAIGMEVFFPVALSGSDTVLGGGLLDIEAQPIKWSFLRRPTLIMTAVAGVVVPVDDEGVWRVEPHLFVDAAAGSVALQGNVIGSLAETGEHELELRASAARMLFFGGDNSAGPLLETIWEIPLGSGGDARVQPFLAPGVKLQLGGWYFGASYLFPVRRGSEESSELAVTGGYHVSFSRS